MRRTVLLVVAAVVSLFVGVFTADAVFAQTAAQAPAMTPLSGRYQLVVVPGHPGSPFLVDTASGCLWHQVQDEKTKRTTFIEVDVENLHWSYSSGAQTLLAARIDAAQITDEQKRTLKQDLQKTGCGSFNVVLAPTAQPQAGGADVPKSITPAAPKANTPKEMPKQETPKSKK